MAYFVKIHINLNFAGNQVLAFMQILYKNGLDCKWKKDEATSQTKKDLKHDW